MKYAERVENDPKVVTSIGLTSAARTALRALAAREGTSASAIVERLILEVARPDHDLSDSSVHLSLS